jgi:hypothetical protein
VLLVAEFDVAFGDLAALVLDLDDIGHLGVDPARKEQARHRDHYRYHHFLAHTLFLASFELLVLACRQYNHPTRQD